MDGCKKRLTEAKIQQQNMTNAKHSILSIDFREIAFDQRLVSKVYGIIRSRHDAAHDFEHITRVCRNAGIIAKAERADANIVLVAALMHDLVVYPKASAKSSKSADDSADMAEEILRDFGWPQDKIDRIGYCIRTHSYPKV